MSAARTSHVGIIVDPSQASLKRLAWAYGTAKKGSDEERQLEVILTERLRTFACKDCSVDVSVEAVRCSACSSTGGAKEIA